MLETINFDIRPMAASTSSDSVTKSSDKAVKFEYKLIEVRFLLIYLLTIILKNVYTWKS